MNKGLLKGLAFFSFMLVSLASISQTIQGVITDETNSTIPGVSVYALNTTLGTATDFEGKYRLVIPEGKIAGDSITIVYSFIGYKTEQRRIPNKPSASLIMDIVLKTEVATLNELVVVGYGVQRKSDVTGAISTIKINEITDQPITRIDQALQGKAAGVQVSSTSGQPGENIKVRIRGIGTINGNDPLYIVDGVPTQDISGILNPEDIESMTVLKDASSAAIYGSRAGNGVVIITTKKGVAGKPAFSYNFYGGIQTHGHLTEMTNTDDYIKIYNEAALADERETIPDAIRSQLSNTDWMKEIFRPAIIQNHEISISGGNDRTTYFVSGGYQKQDGIMLNSAYERINFKTSISTILAKWVTVGSNVNLSFTKQNLVGSSGDGYGGNGGSVVRYAFFRNPAIPVYEADGSFSDIPTFDGYSLAQTIMWFGDGYNPVGLADKYDWTLKTYRMFGDVFAEFTIVKDLKFKSDLGVDVTFSDEKRFNENWGTDGRVNSPNSLSVGTGIGFTYNLTNTLNYTKIFNEKHHLNFLLGTEAIKNQSNGHGASDRDFPDQSPNMRYLGNGLVLNKNAYEYASGWALLSGFARVNYNFDNRYLAEGVIRYDGSSRFSPENRWGAFYSGSLGWNIRHEAFMKDFDWLNQMKLRVGVGQTGNQEIGLYNYLSVVSDGYNYPFSNNNNYGYAVSSLGNINTSWETTTTYDIGLDLAFLDDRLTFITDYYWRYTTDMLIPVSLPASGGDANPPWVNAGEMLNRGLELELFWREERGGFKYEIGGNFSTLHNEVLSLSNGRPIAAGRIDDAVYATLTEVGYPIGSFYIYEMEGIFQNELDIFTHAYQGPGIKPGDVKFKDQNADGIIDEKDRAHVGSGIPRYMYGMTANLAWKGFDLSLFIQGVAGNDIYMQVNQDIEGFYRGFTVTQRYYDNRWTGDGSTNEYPRASWIGSSNNKKASTRFLASGSYARLKNVTLGYNFKLGENSSVKSMRVYISAQNLLTITKYPGLDPEMYDSDNLKSEIVHNADLAPGIDWGTYPLSKIYTLGFNIRF
ncbi:MAG: TonB-dependent receptor [Bacteroidetes bacterium]|nr:TonB-dependent receptor [Bacteroidota bacterium]